jgi:PPOX class probable F420-dependent enzyme
VTPAEALDFLRANPRAVLATVRADGRPQLSPVLAVVDDADRVVVSTRETAVKTKNLRRDPRASLCVMNDQFYGEWCFAEGPCEIVPLPDAMELLVAYYRQVRGEEHPDWDEYRAAMETERRVMLRIRLERVGPTVSG